MSAANEGAAMKSAEESAREFLTSEKWAGIDPNEVDRDAVRILSEFLTRYGDERAAEARVEEAERYNGWRLHNTPGCICEGCQRLASWRH